MLKSQQPMNPIYLKDYKPINYHFYETYLYVSIYENETVVNSTMHFEKKGEHEEPISLEGEKLELKEVKLDGKVVAKQEYTVTQSKLIINKAPAKGVLEISVVIHPENNTELEGLYKSGEIYCTQNEPEGFRRITYFVDRPDNMSKFTTTIEADKNKYPVLLSNGNCIAKKELINDRHSATWEDPFLKPAYLYALVAGNLGSIQDVYTTSSGKKVDLVIYTEKGSESRCYFAMDCLKRSMKWDEKVFGREYDLDIYMIVAVDSFNMGAMENKGLNIFNTSCVLADEKTATDDNFLRVETVICHEYFHNWTGNRITLRDWFQLTLKEGLTVFRDQEFSSDMNDRAVKRIEDVIDLKARQFPEDAGPNAHPIQPTQYIEMNNFYTATIYDKGAEVIRMIHTLLGKERFRKAMDYYFETYDGQAITTEDFIQAMEKGGEIDLKQFRKWYSQVGTPLVKVDFHYYDKEQRFELSVEQCSPKSSHLEPLHFPFAIGLIGADGKEVLPTTVLEIKEKKETFIFENIHSIPLPSLNRHYSAPVHVKAPYLEDDLIFLMKYDTDLFNRYQAAQQLMMDILLETVKKLQKKQEVHFHRGFVDAFKAILEEDLSGSFISKTLSLPSEGLIAEQLEVIDYEAIHEAREFYLRQIAISHKDLFFEIYNRLNGDSKTIDQRRLKNLCLKYLSYLEDDHCVELIYQQFDQAQNMTDEFSALQLLANSSSSIKDQALDQFYKKWSQNTLVMMKWFAVQAGSKLPGALERVQDLMNNPVFDIKVPNLVRAVLDSFAHNYVQFHDEDGKGYQFMADQILLLDEINPLVAARFAKSFEKYEKLDKQRKKLMKKELKRILEKAYLSTNVYEIIKNILK